MPKLNVCLINDSFPPEIDGVANAVTNYAQIITEKFGSAVVVTPDNPKADDSVYPFPVVMASVTADQLQSFVRLHILRTDQPAYKVFSVRPYSADRYRSWHRTLERGSATS